MLFIVAVVFFGFFRAVTPMLFGLPAGPTSDVKPSGWTTWAVAVSLIFIIGMGLFTPQPFDRLLESAGATFLGR